MKTVLSVALLSLGLLQTKAQMGSLDLSFGMGGYVPLGINFTATAFQQDGKLVGIRTVEGDFVVHRYNIDGTPDPSFGTGGVATTNVGSASDLAVSVAIAPEGKIVVAGTTVIPPAMGQPAAPAFAIVRYNSNGTSDASFAMSGIVTERLFFNLDANDQLRKVAVHGDGRILLLIHHLRPGGNKIDIRRYDVNGTRNGGAGILRPRAFGAGPSAISIQNDGKVVVGGSTNPTSAGGNFLLVSRLNGGLIPDASFGGTGRVTYDVSENVITLAVQVSGKIVASGPNNKLLRFNVDGMLDPLFGEGGVVTTPFAVNKILFQSDGKVIVGGGLSNNFALARYNSNGILDAGFGTGGMTTSDFGSDESITDMAIVGPRLYVYGNNILAAYRLSTTIGDSHLAYKASAIHVPNHVVANPVWTSR